ncbi:MoaD/ThiS family protein [Nocardiopsis sediminis]|uniref:MoaD/ThiS family protein n=1 Tax=Nocardiopsis sediminis TaxID=1778267 RepID=A0ABV8FID9_9ACTN
MSVLVFIPETLRPECDGAARITVFPDEGPAAGGVQDVPLREVLDELTRLHPRLRGRLRDEKGALRRYVNVFVDDDECRAVDGLDTPVRPGAEVRVLPSVAGG